MKIRKIKSVQEWTADMAKRLHPYSKTLKAVDWYFATAGYDDVNVEWSRAFDGYSNDHFTPETLAEFYKAAKVEISGNYSITIYDNWKTEVRTLFDPPESYEDYLLTHHESEVSK